MSNSRQLEARFLDNSEKQLVDSSHHPDVGDLSDRELADLRRNLRERRNRARDIANRQRREIRGKGAPRGESRVSEDAGSREKLSVLSSALQRVNNETSRRERLLAAGIEEQCGARTGNASRGQPTEASKVTSCR
ncbi:hypothetical protein [Shinella sp.]|uniref:hypothetical protein n=1 Tax=Shinella sp. TaxID=1870904 RepID=UPI00289F4D15|nr:hypothetical protein [Shinella sp.]